MNLQNSRSLLLLLVGTTLITAGCRIQINGGYSFDYKGQSLEKTESGTVDAAIRFIEVENKFGNVNVAASPDGGSWSWDGSCWASEKSDAETFLSQLQMQTTVEGDKQVWTVVLPERNQNLRGVKSNLEIRVPAEVSVAVVNRHGDVSAQAFSGSVKIDNEHGDVKTGALAGPIQLGNRHGHIVATDLSGAGNVECKHGNIDIDAASAELIIVCEHGNIDVDQASAAMTVNCEHGNLDISSATADIAASTEHGRATIETSGANVSCDTEHCDLKITFSGDAFQSVTADAEHSDVTVVLPASAQPKLDLTVEHGRKDSDFESSAGNASPLVDIDAEHGDIAIRSR